MSVNPPYAYNTSWEKVRRVFPTAQHLRILDLGCGDGRVVEHLVKDHEVFGLDTSAEGVRIAQTKGIHAALGSVDGQFDFPGTAFDVVLALDILEHLQHLSDTLAQVKKVLKPGGFLIISIPNHFDLRTRLEILCGKGIVKWSQRQYTTKAWEYEHIRFLRLEDMLEVLREQGFRVDKLQCNFMSQGLLPTRLLPAGFRRFLTKHWPNLWSGKFVMRVALNQGIKMQHIILDSTPLNF